MRERTIKDTELDIVLSSIASYALSEEGRREINSSKVTTDLEELERRYIKIDNLINRLEGAEPLDTFPSLSNLFKFVSSSHSDIPSIDIYKCGEFLHSYFVLLHFLEKESEIDTRDKEIEKNILSSLNSEGEVLPEHPRLKPLIKKRDEIKNDRYRFSLSFISSNRTIVQNDNPIYRNERVVIPIHSTEKKSGEYYISGQSGSGNTTFVEPFELVDLNNKVVLAEERIRIEKIKIVHELSDSVRRIIKNLKEKEKEVIDFDFHYVFALWCRRVKASHATISSSLNLIEARHPLLLNKAVPITVRLDENTKTLVLSGANAGGKTVTMKTVALLSLLNQICTFIPASSLSTLPLFSSVLTDIGDMQSIKDEQSTFSSHMKNISYIVRNADENSLVILDELGSGTDPEEGSVLSLSVLKYLSKKAKLTICTSHYNQVKNFAYTEKNMINASMEFDTKTSLPTFKVLPGIPGDSHALSTAKRSGIIKEIIDDAYSMLGEGKESSAQIITSLLSKSRTLDRKMSEVDREKRALEQKIKEVEEREKELKNELLLVKKDGYKDLNDYLVSSRKELENLVRMVKTGEINKEKTKSVKSFISKIEDQKKRIEEEIEKEEECEEESNSDKPFLIGDDVLCGKGKTRGKIVGNKGKLFIVSFENGLKMNLSAENMIHAKKESSKATITPFFSTEKKAKYELDVRGKTMEEVERILDDQIESMILSSLSSFTIIHGYGDGILQRGVHEYLKRNILISDYRFALPEDGGMGKTYVFMKKE